MYTISVCAGFSLANSIMCAGMCVLIGCEELCEVEPCVHVVWQWSDDVSVVLSFSLMWSCGKIVIFLKSTQVNIYFKLN